MKHVTNQYARRWLSYGFICLLFSWVSMSHAEEKPLNVVATFSILGDMAKSVGGDRVEVSTLVGPTVIVNAIVEQLQETYRCDWHRFAGRAVLKACPTATDDDIEALQNVLEMLLVHN